MIKDSDLERTWVENTNQASTVAKPYDKYTIFISLKASCFLFVWDVLPAHQYSVEYTAHNARNNFRLPAHHE
jgi:hypothetical protein